MENLTRNTRHLATYIADYRDGKLTREQAEVYIGLSFSRREIPVEIRRKRMEERYAPLIALQREAGL